MDYKVTPVYGKIINPEQTVSVPGSKSITARAMLIAALAKGESTLLGAGLSDDCLTFAECLVSLGIDCKIDGDTVKINGCGGNLPKKEGEIYVGSAGTAARFLPAMLAFCDGKYLVKCSPQMSKRPIAPLIEALKSLGAKIEFCGAENSFPFTIEGARNVADEIEVDIGASSQFLSALLISAVLAKKPVKIIPRGAHGLGYVNMTLDTMWSFGVSVKEEGGAYEVEGNYSAKLYEIEPDYSAAAYFYAMNKILGTDIKVRGVMGHSMQSDSKFIQILPSFDGGKIDMSAFSDQALTLAAIAPFLGSPTEICNVAHIRGQECDRIAAIMHNLQLLGARCEERADGVVIYPSKLHGASLPSFGDHRVAMSFSLTGLRQEGIIIEKAEVCSKTFKEYFDVLDGLCKNLTVKL